MHGDLVAGAWKDPMIWVMITRSEKMQKAGSSHCRVCRAVLANQSVACGRWQTKMTLAFEPDSLVDYFEKVESWWVRSCRRPLIFAMTQLPMTNVDYQHLSTMQSRAPTRRSLRTNFKIYGWNIASHFESLGFWSVGGAYGEMT